MRIQLADDSHSRKTGSRVSEYRALIEATFLPKFVNLMARKSRNSNWESHQESVPTVEESAGEEDALQTLTRQCQSNTETLHEMLEKISSIHSLIVSHTPDEIGTHASGSPNDSEEQLRTDIDDLQAAIIELEKKNNELAQQNDDLESRLANHSVESSLGNNEATCNETMSWEDRKQMMLRQMEAESFDADAFVDSLNGQTSDEIIDPIQYVEELQNELDRRDKEVERREQQVQELQYLLDQQSETREGGIAIGAAAITEMYDTDELVRDERERLQQMQEEWEEKFRQAEIEASLERAKLSRERQEVASKLADLEEQLAHAKRESRHSTTDDGAGSRRWLAKLGLAEGSA